MNFYRAQDDARRKTWQLALLFGAAVLSLIVLTNVLVAGVWVWMSDLNRVGPLGVSDTLNRIPLEQWFWVSFGVIGVVASACLFKYLMIRGGGRAVAESLGGRQILQQTQDGKQKRLLNVVEETALAAGIPVPPVYLIPEPSINAFAAGFGTDDAVIGINQGTIDHLTREELQGVIAHEFSHIFNGDMRINLRLIALLHGIVFIGIIGYTILRGGGTRRGRSEGSGGVPLAILAFGLIVIGYGGTFFGNLIKAAVSRQREFLADASAVQYTRNPQGIANALKKIGGLSHGSIMQSANAKEVSHMFFGQAVTSFLGGLMATHPPLDERIKLLDPGWRGNFQAIETLPSAMGDDPLTSSFATHYDPEAFRVQAQAEQIPDDVGNPNAISEDNAIAIIDSSHPALQSAAHEPWAARALVYSLLIATDNTVRSEQLSYLAQREHHGTPGEVIRLLTFIDPVDDLHRLTLWEAATPALKEMSKAQYQRFLSNVVELIKADRNIALFEWVLHRLLIKELKPHYEGPQVPRRRYRRVTQVDDAAAILLSALACAGSSDDVHSRQQAFTAGAKSLALESLFDPRPDDNYSRLSAAINQLNQLRPLAKPQLLKAAALTVLADEYVSVAQGALLQGVSAALNCPLPPSIYQHS